MPRIADLGSCQIYIYFGASEHNLPHFHVVNPDYQAVFRISDLVIIAGSLRKADERKARKWAEQNRELLSRKWQELSG